MNLMVSLAIILFTFDTRVASVSSSDVLPSVVQLSIAPSKKFLNGNADLSDVRNLLFGFNFSHSTKQNQKSAVELPISYRTVQATSLAPNSRKLEYDEMGRNKRMKIPLRYSNKIPNTSNKISDVRSENHKFGDISQKIKFPPIVLNKIQCLYIHLKNLSKVSDEKFKQVDNALMNQFADLYESLKREIIRERPGKDNLTTLDLFKKICERLNADFLNYGQTNVGELLGNFIGILRRLKVRFRNGLRCVEMERYNPMQVRWRLSRSGSRRENVSCQKQTKEHYVSKLESLFDLHPNEEITFHHILKVVDNKNMTVEAKLRKIFNLSGIQKLAKYLKTSKYETLKNICKKTKYSIDTLKLLLDSFNGTYANGDKCNECFGILNRKLLKLILYLVLQKEVPKNNIKLCYKDEKSKNLIDVLEVIDMKKIAPKIYHCLLEAQPRPKRSFKWKKNLDYKHNNTNSTIDDESFEQKDAKYHETLTRIRNINKLLSLFEPFGGTTSLIDEKTSTSNTNLDNLLKNVYESDYHPTKLRDKRSVNSTTNNSISDPQILNENETIDDSPLDYSDEETEINSLENETKVKFIYLWERLFQSNLSSNNTDKTGSFKNKLNLIKSQIERNNKKSAENEEPELDNLKESFVLPETDNEADSSASQIHHYVETDLESDVNKPGESFAALLDHIKELIESLELSPSNLKTITQLRFIAALKHQPSEISIENAIISRKRTKSIALADLNKSTDEREAMPTVTQKKVRRLMKTLNKLMQQINRIEKKRQKRNVNKKELVNFIKQFKFADRSNDMCLESPSETSYNGHRYTVLYGKKSVIPPHLIHDLKKADIAILYIQADTVLNIIQSFMGIASSNGIYYQIDKPLQIIQGVLEKFNKLTTVVIFYDSDPNNFFFKYLTYIEPAMNCATFIIQTVNRDWNPEKFDFHDMKQRGDRYVECGLKNMIVQKIYDTFSCRVEAQSKETFKESSTMRLEKIINKGLKKIFNEEILKQRSIKPLDVLNLVESYFNESSHKVKNFKGKCVDCFDSMKVERKTSYDSRKSGWLGEIFMHRDSSTSIDYPLVERYKRGIDLSDFFKYRVKKSTMTVDQELRNEDSTEKKIWSDLIQDLKTRAKAIGVELIPLTSGTTKKFSSSHSRNYLKKLTRKRKDDRKSGPIRARFVASRKKNMVVEKENPNADSVPTPLYAYQTKDIEKKPYYNFHEIDETDDHVSNEGDIEDRHSFQEGRWKRSYIAGSPMNEDLMPTLNDYLTYPDSKSKDEEENFYTLLTMEEGAHLQGFSDQSESSSTRFSDLSDFNNDYIDKNDKISENGDLIPHAVTNNTMDVLENTNCAHETSEIKMDLSEGTASETYSENKYDEFGDSSASLHENRHFPNEDRSLETVPNIQIAH